MESLMSDTSPLTVASDPDGLSQGTQYSTSAPCNFVDLNVGSLFDRKSCGATFNVSFPMLIKELTLVSASSPDDSLGASCFADVSGDIAVRPKFVCRKEGPCSDISFRIF